MARKSRAFEMRICCWERLLVTSPCIRKSQPSSLRVRLGANSDTKLPYPVGKREGEGETMLQTIPSCYGRGKYRAVGESLILRLFPEIVILS